MEYLPKPLTEAETSKFIDRLILHFTKNGYNYFVTEVLETRELIGFIGLANQAYKSDFTPAVDIGCALKKALGGKVCN